MTDRPGPDQSPDRLVEHEERKRRQAEALRLNLLRRKAQMRAKTGRSAVAKPATGLSRPRDEGP